LEKKNMEKTSYHVFSYGSNLVFERIRDRIKSVKVIAKYNLIGYRLVFNKAGVDGSAKANIEETDREEDSVWGVVHEMDYAEKPILDKHETLGHGYQLICFRLNINGGIKTIHTYIVNENRFILHGKPFDWYLNFVIAGAKQNNFPHDYIAKLKKVDSEYDQNTERRKKNMDILKLSGMCF
jgi:gamma-glutamylcyclotransferase